MTLRDIRKSSVERMDSDIVRLEDSLHKMRAKHDDLQQSLFDLSKKMRDAPISAALVRKTEELKKQISDSMVDIHHLDAKISKLRHRADRLRLHR